MAEVKTMDKRNLLLSYIASSDIKKLKNMFTNNSARVKIALKQWSIADHEVMKRPPKILKDGLLDLAKLPVPYQKKIVNSALAFLFAKPVRFIQEGVDENTPAFEKFMDIRKDMRSHTKDRENGRIVMSETESAKLFVPYRGAGTDPYDLVNTVIGLRCIILCKSNGDTLYVCEDDFGSFIAFARGYKVKDLEGKYIEHFDVYMDDFLYFMDDDGGNWKTFTKPNLIKKIPVVYYSQPQSEWADVQPLIERYEMCNSKRGDVNDFTGDPILLLRGSAESLPQRDESGKVILLEGKDSSAEYLAPSMALDMVKDERQTLETQIHYFTDTPYMSEENLKSLGQDSGKALEMRFFPATLKAMSKKELYEEMFDRENNIIKAFMKNVLLIPDAESLEISMEFGNPLPDNVEDLISMLVNAKEGNILAQETAVANNPFVKDAKKEMELIKAQEKEQMLLMQKQEESFTKDEE